MTPHSKVPPRIRKKMSFLKKQYYKLKKAGVCTSCKKEKAEFNRARCIECGKHARDNTKNRQKFEHLSLVQMGKCGLCENELNNKYVIDHCHKTGIVRAALCPRCNIGLGMFDDDVQKLQKAIEYINKFK